MRLEGRKLTTAKIYFILAIVCKLYDQKKVIFVAEIFTTGATTPKVNYFSEEFVNQSGTNEVIGNG